MQPLVNIVDRAALFGEGRLLLWRRVRRAEIRRSGFADGGIEPVVQRHAGAARGGLGPLADGWIDALNAPRYARIHVLVRFRLRHRPGACSLPARPTEETIEIGAGRLPQNLTFSRYGK